MTTPIVLDPAECRRLMESPQWLTKVTPSGPDDCWLWQGRRAKGHGRVRLDSGISVVTHRVVLTVTLGRPIVPGMIAGHVCHDEAYARGECRGGDTCSHRSCVNPAHLREMTTKENYSVGAGPGVALMLRTHCSRGHPLDGPDADISPWHKGRSCRQCARVRNSERAELVLQAARSLGLSRDEYVRKHGWSTSIARGFLDLR